MFVCNNSILDQVWISACIHNALSAFIVYRECEESVHDTGVVLAQGVLRLHVQLPSKHKRCCKLKSQLATLFAQYQY